jgi:hypothetical protein
MGRCEWEHVVPEFVKPFTQKFKIKEHYGFMVKKYNGMLEEELDPFTHWATRQKIHAPVMKITNYFWTMHAHQEALFWKEDPRARNGRGMQVGDYTMFHPKYFARRWTWRVVKSSNMDEVLFTIQKRLWRDHCKFLGWFSCRPVLKIYRGHRGDKSTLIYYGVGDKSLSGPDFKFYHSRDEYKGNRWSWVAKVDHKKTKMKGKVFAADEYKVTVKRHKDAALLLLATTCLDQIGDAAGHRRRRKR